MGQDVRSQYLCSCAVLICISSRYESPNPEPFALKLMPRSYRPTVKGSIFLDSQGRITGTVLSAQATMEFNVTTCILYSEYITNP